MKGFVVFLKEFCTKTYGWRYPREWFINEIQTIATLAPYIIYIAHVKDKFLKNDGGSDIISGQELNLTGKLKNMLAVRVSTVAKLIPDGNKRYLSFEVQENNFIGGSRVPKFKEKILISDIVNGNIVTYWNNVYENLNKTQNKK